MTVSGDADSRSSVDATTIRPSSLSTSHDVTVESWSVTFMCACRPMSIKSIHNTPISLVSSTAACIQRNLYYRWLASECRQTFFKSLLLLQFFCVSHETLAHMILVPICKNCGTDFENFYFIIWQFFFWISGTAAVELSTFTGLSSRVSTAWCGSKFSLPKSTEVAVVVVAVALLGLFLCSIGLLLRLKF